MLAALDVQYFPGDTAVVACVLFPNWPADAAHRDFTLPIAHVAPYQPGEFYKRELPCLLAALHTVADPLVAIIIDGYVTLDAAKKPGLGAHLFAALGNTIPVIGVAKTSFAGAPATALLRGNSAKPLFITAAGIAEPAAAVHISSMHGPHRIPTMLRRADQLCREIKI